MAGDLALPDKITKDKDTEFNDWFNQILTIAQLLDRRYEVKSMYIWLPYGIKLMKQIQKIWDELFEEAGILETYFPLLVPKEYAQKNDSWFEGFKEEAFWARGGISSDSEESLMLRPTGEPAMYPVFSQWIKTKSDLPVRIYETVSSFRYETKNTKNLIRDREITFWYEIHTAHASKQQADEELVLHVKINDDLWNNYLAVPAIRVNKPDWEVFPGAVGAIEYYTIMPNGRILENGSVNHLGQAYAKKFDIKFIDEEKGETHYVWQICTGNGARYLAAVIAQHSDKFGLVIPPKITPYPVIITLIMKSGADINEQLIDKGKDLVKRFKKIGMKAMLDDSADRPGEKYYRSELKGYPVRIEIGSKEFESGSYSVFRRDVRQRENVQDDELETRIIELLDEIQSHLHEKAVEYYEKQQKYTTNLQEAVSYINDGYVTQVPYCAQQSCWNELKVQGDGFELVGTYTEVAENESPCIICQNKTNIIGLYGHSY